MADCTLMHGDCLLAMTQIPDARVDMILCDLPYEMLACEWDKIIPFEPLWQQYKRIIKPNGAMVFTACQPFTTKLINSQPNLFRYSLVWKKTKKVGFLNARKMPMRTHEDILVFYKKLPTYNPQGVEPLRRRTKRTNKYSNAYKYKVRDDYQQEYTNYPGSVLEIASEQKTVHPTQKPVALMEYLIQTYTNPGDLVLDNCMGSGTTGVAAITSGRRFIGIEKDTAFFQNAVSRIHSVAGESLIYFDEISEFSQQDWEQLKKRAGSNK